MDTRHLQAPQGVRHLISGYDVGRDRLYGHIKKRKSRAEFLEFCRYIRSLYPAEIRLHFVLDNFSPHHRRAILGLVKAYPVVL